MLTANAQLAEQAFPVVAFPAATPSSATPVWVSLKNYWRCQIIVAANNATTVTGSAIGLQQATDVSGTGAKTLGFTVVKANYDTGSNDPAVNTLTDTPVTSNTFTTSTTNSKSQLYVIDVKCSDLDVNNGYDCLRVSIGNGTATTITAIYQLYVARYEGDMLSPITN